jgi:hypothetical protein
MQQYTSQEYYFSILRTWADQVFNTLSEAIDFAKTDWKEGAESQFFEQRKHLRFKLATLLTEGHELFPNLHTEEAGEGQEQAFRGHREEILNSLLSSWDAVTNLNSMDDKGRDIRRDELIAAKRVLVCQIQSVLDPANRDIEFARIVRQGR